jgi:hypothetical protein
VITELAEVIQAALEARLSSMHVAIPGKVVSYNATTQTADVRPGVKRAVSTAVEGEFITEELPVIPSVPVCWPGGSGGHFRPSLSSGDGVLIVVCDLDPATWVRTGEVSDPGDLRRFDLSHAVCLPGFRPASGAISPSDPDVKSASAAFGGSTDAAALASMLDKLIAVLKTAGVGAATNVPGVLTTAFPSLVGSTAPTGAITTGSTVLKVGS